MFVPASNTSLMSNGRSVADEAVSIIATSLRVSRHGSSATEISFSSVSSELQNGTEPLIAGAAENQPVSTDVLPSASSFSKTSSITLA